MRYNEFKINTAPVITESARIQHAEDIIFWEGSNGALRALHALENLANNGHKDVTIKWDGSPAIVFGRDENGDFVLTDKSGFTAKGYDGKATSADQLEQMFLNRSNGKNKENPSYIKFAKHMKDIFNEYEKAVPKDFTGYFKGDLLYFNTPQVSDNNYRFRPNVVEYAVDVNSELGKRIGKSTTGVVVHNADDISILQGTNVLVVPPVSVEHPAQVPHSELDQLRQTIKQDAAGIDELLNTVELKQQQMTDFPKILYAYTNSKVDTGMHNLGKDFADWLEQHNRISDKKKVRILAYIKQHATAFATLWHTVNTLMQVKDHIIAQFDAHDSTVAQSINGTEGGEGYVLAHPAGDIKLVPREFFTKANRAVQR